MSQKARVYLTSYATERFAKVQQDLNISAIKNGICNIITYQESDLKKSDYYQKNRSILDEVCGAGYWAWKPYFILEALHHLEENDILFYCDSGSAFLQSPMPLIKLCEEHSQGMILFDARPLTNRQFTKRDCFVKMECDTKEYWNAKKVIATLLVVKKTDFSQYFLQEWLRYCQDRAAITDDPNECGLDNLEGYLQHRWDQAILSVLAGKYNIETFRNPTFHGNFLKIPEYRVKNELITSPYYLPPNVSSYSSTPQINSPYGTIFEINRLPNYLGKQPLPEIKTDKKLTPLKILMKKIRGKLKI